MTPNQKAFLDTIATSEGTAGKGDNGYNVLFGGDLFKGYADHPRREVWVDRLRIWTSAAGRYQLEVHWYDAYKKILKLPDFSPISQDRIALTQMEERGAFPLLQDGNIDAALAACSRVWASLPGAGYGQPETTLPVLRAAYLKAGGTIGVNYGGALQTAYSAAPATS